MRKLKILIVDFDEEASRYLAEFLKAEGFAVSEAADGELGLEKCKAEMPDLVVVEPMISKLHGFELCSIITNDFNGKIPVVILTKFYREEQFKIEAMRSYGAAAFLSKPFKGPDILEAIKNLLKDKIKEDEGEEMAEDTQILDEVTDKELEALEIDTPALKPKEDIVDLDREIRQSMVPPPGEAEPRVKKAKTSKIDKMLEDTLSEFGLNIDKKEKPKAEGNKEFQAKMDALVEELKNGKKSDDAETLEPTAKKPAAKESETKNKASKETIQELKAEEPEAKEPEIREAGTKEEIIAEAVNKESANEKPEKVEPEKSTATAEEPQSEQAGDVKQDTPIFAAETEEKEKSSFLQTLKESIPFLKKHPLKFIIPGALVAAIAVSASFVFRKPDNPAPIPRQTNTAMQLAKSREMTEPEDIVVANSNRAEEDTLEPRADEKSKNSVEKKETTEPQIQEATVKTRVSQVFQVENPGTKPKPDLNPIDVSEDIISTEPDKEIAAPILSEREPVPPPEQITKPNTLATAEAAPVNSGQVEAAKSAQEKKDTPSPSEQPQTKLGDLIPMSEVDIPPEIAKRIEPEYPSYALSRGVGGKVILNALINENGDVIEVAVIRGIKGPYGFNEECEKAVRQWKFVPAFKDGIKVKVWKTISFTFKNT